MFLLATINSIILTLWYPNVYRFYDLVRALFYGIVAGLSVLFFVVEFTVAESQYKFRESMAFKLSVALLVMIGLIIIVLMVIVYRQFEQRTAQDAERHRKEVEALFNAISTGHAGHGEHNEPAGEKHEHQHGDKSAGGVGGQPNQLYFGMIPKRIEALKHDGGSSQPPPEESPNSVTKMSIAKFPWMNCRILVEEAVAEGLLAERVAEKVLEEIDNEGYIIIYLFERSANNFNKFLDLLGCRVSEVLGADEQLTLTREAKDFNINDNETVSTYSL